MCVCLCVYTPCRHWCVCHLSDTGFSTTEDLSLIHSHPPSDPDSGVCPLTETQRKTWNKGEEIILHSSVCLHTKRLWEIPIEVQHLRNVTRERPHNPHKESKLWSNSVSFNLPLYIEKPNIRTESYCNIYIYIYIYIYTYNNGH